MEGRIDLAMAVWEAVRPYALASAGGSLVALLIFALARG